MPASAVMATDRSWRSGISQMHSHLDEGERLALIAERLYSSSYIDYIYAGLHTNMAEIQADAAVSQIADIR